MGPLEVPSFRFEVGFVVDGNTVLGNWTSVANIDCGLCEDGTLILSPGKADV